MTRKCFRCGRSWPAEHFVRRSLGYEGACLDCRILSDLGIWAGRVAPLADRAAVRMKKRHACDDSCVLACVRCGSADRPANATCGLTWWCPQCSREWVERKKVEVAQGGKYPAPPQPPYRPEPEDPEGERFGKLTVVGRSRTKNPDFLLCMCDCGTSREALWGNLAGGMSYRSCGFCRLENEWAPRLPHWVERPYVGRLHVRDIYEDCPEDFDSWHYEKNF